MDVNRLRQKLVAILYADVADYSRLTGDDEIGTHLVLSNRLDMLTAAIERHAGHVVHFAGDAVLAEFDSVASALACALGAQQIIEAENAALPKTRRVRFRIGVNLGEVIADRGDIYGDGVNVAARLEGLALPGGVCASASVRDAIGTKLPLDFEDLGEQQVKNIANPVRAYRIRLKPGATLDHAPPRPENRTRRRLAAGTVVATLAVLFSAGIIWVAPWKRVDEPAPTTTSALHVGVAHDKPSLAVLPFANRSDDPDQSYFAEGITDDLTTDLSKISALFIVGRESARAYRDQPLQVINRDLGVRFVLRGSIRRAGDNVRINAQLVEAATGGNVWAERYDGRLDDVFALQDSVTQRIVSALSVTLNERERTAIAQRFTTDTGAYDLLLRGNSLINRLTVQSNSEAREYYLAALERDPRFARAYGGLALSHAYDGRFRWSADRASSLSLAHEAAREAVRLAPKLAHAHFSLGVVLTFMKRSEQAIAVGRKATELNPNFSDGHALLGVTLTHAGRAAEALRSIDEAMRLNPAPPAFYLIQRGRALYFLRRYEEAVSALEAAVEQNPELLLAQIYLTATYAKLGRDDDAEWSAAEVLAHEPDFEIESWVENEIFTERAYVDELIAGLSGTSLPRR